MSTVNLGHGQSTSPDHQDTTKQGQHSSYKDLISLPSVTPGKLMNQRNIPYN